MCGTNYNPDDSQHAAEDLFASDEHGEETGELL